MKIADTVLEEMVKGGLLASSGATVEQIKQIVETVKGCDEATVILRKNGKAVGVLVVADDGAEGAAQRGHEALAQLQRSFN
jgi:hypothetical protein